jgi:hypothetical protein
MNWLFGYTGLSEAKPSDQNVQVDYSYVFGNTRPAVRHDPHVHDQGCAADVGLLKISDLIRDRGDGEPAAA